MGTYMIKEDMHKFVNGIPMDVGLKKDNIWFMEFKDKFMVVKREGICDYKKCKNSCCKFCSAGYLTDYSRGFFEKDEFGNEITRIKCNNLNKDGTCSKWNKKLPNPCKQFPHPSDPIYWNVMDKCSFKFKILWSQNIKMNMAKARKEMIKCFAEQFALE